MQMYVSMTYVCLEPSNQSYRRGSVMDSWLWYWDPMQPFTLTWADSSLRQQLVKFTEVTLSLDLSASRSCMGEGKISKNVPGNAMQKVVASTRTFFVFAICKGPLDRSIHSSPLRAPSMAACNLCEITPTDQTGY